MLRKLAGWLRGPQPTNAQQAAPNPLEFDPVTLPWIDRDAPDIAGYVASLRRKPGYDLRAKLAQWHDEGIVAFPQLIPHALIDAFRADLDELFEDRARHGTRVLLEVHGIKPISETTLEQLRHKHARVTDFHNQSVAAKKIILHPGIVEFAEHVFRDKVVAMQTIAFWRGSEQKTHKDYAYVVSEIPSHLCATWIALEDVDADAGPLEYFPGSHRLSPKFDWGNGMFATTESSRSESDFRDHLEAECAKRGIAPRSFVPRKGDVLFWHGALAHRGGAVRNPSLTRLSLVAHYSSASAYRRDRRAPGEEPRVFEYNGGLVYGDPRLPAEEDSFTRGSVF